MDPRAEIAGSGVPVDGADGKPYLMKGLSQADAGVLFNYCRQAPVRSLKPILDDPLFDRHSKDVLLREAFHAGKDQSERDLALAMGTDIDGIRLACWLAIRKEHPQTTREMMPGIINESNRELWLNCFTEANGGAENPTKTANTSSTPNPSPTESENATSN